MRQPRHRGPQLLPAVLVAAATAATLASAQAPPGKPQDPPQPPVFRAEANYVRVDVYPTRDGKPVLDLAAEDFQVFEDGVPQTLATFEHVQVAPAGPQESRIEPNTIEASRQLAANPRNRVFVLFLDIQHVSIDGAWHSREPLIRMIDSILGDDDLVGIMTPEMSAADLVLGRKTEVLAAGLREKDPWGERHRLTWHEREEMYRRCYPGRHMEEVVTAMARRRHERATLEAMHELVHYLSGIREDRKAIVTVTEGWALYRPDADITRLREDPDTLTREPIPSGPGIFVGPDGRLRSGADPRAFRSASKADCDRERLYLSMIDNWEFFREIVDDANRWNASFYTIDPRGLPVFDDPIGPAPPPPPNVSMANVTRRHDAMRILAENTDGLAVLNSNDLNRGLKRISDDLTSYYLLGYYSTNGSHDGKFRSINVKVTQPDVQVRARRGYRAATEEEVRGARAAAASAVPEPVAAVQTSIASLARLDSDTPLRIRAVPAHTGTGFSTVWVAGEVRSGAVPAGATLAAEIQVTGAARGAARVTLPAGQRSFLTAVTLDGDATGSLDVRTRLTGGETPLNDSIRVSRDAPEALLFRRGPSTGNRLQPAGDPQFSRTERVRLEVPAGPGLTARDGRVLDRNAQPLGVPVTLGERIDEASGQRFLTADLTLAPLGMGDYAIELDLAQNGSDMRVLTAIRVTR